MLQGIAVQTFSGERMRAAKLVWIEGEMRRGWLGTFLLPKRKTRPYEIVAFRCPTCGLVEFYSPPG
jgi:hypothetical protein